MTSRITPADDQSPNMLVTATVLMVSSLTIMANATIAPSLPGLAASFADVAGIETLSGMVLSLPSLAIILTAALFGVLADRVSRRKLLAFAMALYGLGGASGFLASSMIELLIGRVILGIGVAGILTITTMLAADLWTGRARVQFMGRQAAAVSAGGIAFLLLGGLLAEASWRAPFLIYLLAVPFAIAAWAILPETQIKPKSPDQIAPSIDLRKVAPILALVFFTMVAFYIIPTRLPFLMAQIGLTAPSLSGMAIAAVTATSIISALAFSRFRARFEPLTLFGLSFVFMAIGYGLIGTASGFGQVVVGTLTVGLGLGAIMPNQNAWLMSVVDENTRGRAAGLLTTFVFAGQFAAPFVAGGLAQIMSLSAVFLVFSGALVGVAVLLWGLSFGRRAAVAEDSEH